MFRIYIITLLACATLVLLSFKDQLFGEYVQMTSDQFKYGGEDIRLFSANFFLTEYWPGWFAKVIGNGTAYSTSLYGKEMLNINLYLNFYRSDVGIIGAYNQFGILYVLNILWVNIKGLLGRYFDYENKYLRLFFFNALLLILLSEYYSNGSAIPFYCFIFYLVDKSFEEKQSVSETIEHDE